MDVPGRPILYRTTDIFLRTFSLTSLSELPALPSLEENEQMELRLEEAAPEQEVDGQIGLEQPSAGTDETE